MDPELKKIYEKHIVHNSFLDQNSVESCMKDSFNLGVKKVLEWLSKQDYLSDNINYIIEEWDNQNKA
jgi:hypothetical protein